jgi:hypothetical protein
MTHLGAWLAVRCYGKVETASSRFLFLGTRLVSRVYFLRWLWMRRFLEHGGDAASTFVGGADVAARRPYH